MTDVFTAVEGKQKYMKMLGGRPSEVVESENKNGKKKNNLTTQEDFLHKD